MIIYLEAEVYAKFIIPERSKNNIELRIDISIGKYWKQYILSLHPEVKDEMRTYQHLLPNGIKVPAFEYPHKYLGDFKYFINEIWMPEHGIRYFSERAPELLQYIPKMFVKNTCYPKLIELSKEYTLKLENKAKRIGSRNVKLLIAK